MLLQNRGKEKKISKTYLKYKYYDILRSTTTTTIVPYISSLHSSFGDDWEGERGDGGCEPIFTVTTTYYVHITVKRSFEILLFIRLHCREKKKKRKKEKKKKARKTKEEEKRNKEKEKEKRNTKEKKKEDGKDVNDWSGTYMMYQTVY